MLREVDMMTALEVTLQGGTAVRVMEVQDVAGMTVEELMHSGENEYRYLIDVEDEPEIEPKIDTPSPEIENVSEISEPEEAEPEKPEKTRKKPGPKPKVDVGKILALYNAGWSAAQIAGELGCSVPTVRSYLPLD